MRSGKLEPGWTRVAFGEMATCVNDRIDDPSTIARGTSILHLGQDRCEALPIRLSATDVDREMTAHILSSLDQAAFKISGKILAANRFCNTLMRQMFSSASIDDDMNQSSN